MYLYSKYDKMPFDGVEPLEDFDWSQFGDTETGGVKLAVNAAVKTSDATEKVYCFNDYADELYNRMFGHGHTFGDDFVAKDAITGVSYNVTDISICSDHEVSVDTNCGFSGVVDMLKEKEYMKLIGCDSISTFMAYVADPNFKAELLSNDMCVRVCEGGRISLWEGHKARVESDLIKQITDPKSVKSVYYAKIEEINNGGYFVDVCGVKCFMPGSLAAAGIISDYASMLGKSVPVMAVNCMKNSGFVVSYKKYLSTILPIKIKNELSEGMEVSAKVTGSSRNALFIIFKDSDGEWLYSALLHRSSMSRDFEYRFDHKEFRNGDEMHMFIHSINEQPDGSYRILLSDNLEAAARKAKEEERRGNGRKY